MKNFRIKLLRQKNISEGTLAFYFTKPDGFKFKAGDYGKFTLINPQKSDIKGNTRSFSFSNIPDESELMITIRQTNSSFKKTLASLPKGAELDLLAPISMIQIPMNAKRPVVFLCGGIGVSVARSMIKTALLSGFSEKIVLLNSNHDVSSTVFFQEFKDLSKRNGNFIYIPTITGKADHALWKGRHGYINEGLLKEAISGLDKPIFYITGTNKFVWGMYKLLKEIKISDSAINFDEFTGY